MDKLKQRLASRSEDGLTLIELTVGMFILGLVSIMIFNLFVATNETANTVQRGSISIADVQFAVNNLSQDVRNSDSFQVSEDGNRLDITTTDNECRAWVFRDGALYSNTGMDSYQEWNEEWFLRFASAEVANSRFFTPVGVTGLRYDFTVGEGVGSFVMDAELHSRLARDNDSSPCFEGGSSGGSGPTDPGEETPSNPQFPITYNLDGGTVSDNPVIYTASAAFTLTNPTKPGFIFLGWTGTGLSSPTMTVSVPAGSTGARTYTATWQPVPVFSITYNLNGGTISGQPTQYTSSDGAITLPAPQRTGFTFAGWTGTDLSTATQVVTIPAGATGNRTYTATWTANPAALEATWSQTGNWNRNVQGMLRFKNTTSEPLRNVVIELRVQGATDWVAGNAFCSYLGSNTFRCAINGWSNVNPGDFSDNYFVQFSGNDIRNNTTPTVTILSVTKAS